jgi:single-strand DNA-binding protein
MASLNKVQIIGFLGRDPEVKFMPDGAITATLSIATTEQWRDRDTQEKMEETTWHRVVLFRRLAEIARDYLKSGSLTYVEGRLINRNWTDKSGVKRWATEVVADELKMLGKKADADSTYQQNPGSDQEGADDN